MCFRKDGQWRARASVAWPSVMIFAVENVPADQYRSRRDAPKSRSFLIRQAVFHSLDNSLTFDNFVSYFECALSRFVIHLPSRRSENEYSVRRRREDSGGDVRRRHHRRRNQRLRYRTGCGRPGSIGVLCEQADLASGTSSTATKLIHGGLRYLSIYEFRLVREALMEREVLWRMAPHIIWPLRFVLPYHKGLRPAWLLRLGLFLYDHLGGRKLLPPTSTLDLTIDEAGRPLKPGLYSLGFEYSDCWVDDARLVILNARDAADRGATIRTRTKAVAADRGADIWRLRPSTGAPAGRPRWFAQRFWSMPQGLGSATFSLSPGGRIRPRASGWYGDRTS